MEDIILDMKLIQLQISLAKRSVKKIYTPLNTPLPVEIHIEHSLNSLNHLISKIEDFNLTAD
ncbi:MAG: hypothetical protein COA30_00835 [Sulfurimonas sp.]|nr:MAG: hypothetical protein COA30_00835 [Sulfurimonas sp.]